LVTAISTRQAGARIARGWATAKRWLGESVNGLSERLAGRDRRFRYGIFGLTTLPPLASDSLNLSPKAARTLASSRVYLLHGTPWPGVANNGGGWMQPWATKLEELGVGRAVPIHYGGTSSLLANLRVMLEPIFGINERRILTAIDKDLATNPLKAGERIFLLGHSYGSRMSVPVADKLKGRGLPVEGVIMIENRVPAPVGQFVKRAPGVKRLLEIENNPGKLLETKPGTRYQRHVSPELSHMDFVLNPPARLLERILEELGTH
jgi:hypothetical protein